MSGNCKPDRPHQVWSDIKPDVALGEGCAHPQEAAALQRGEIAMHQSGGRRGSGAAEIALLEQDDAQVAAGGVAREARAVQAATDDRQIVVRHELKSWVARARCALGLPDLAD